MTRKQFKKRVFDKVLKKDWCFDKRVSKSVELSKGYSKMKPLKSLSKEDFQKAFTKTLELSHQHLIKIF